MAFEITNVLHNPSLKKYAIPAVLLTAGIAIFMYFKSKGNVNTNVSSSTGSGASTTASGSSGADSGGQDISSVVSQFNSSINATNTALDTFKQDEKNNFGALNQSIADILASNNKGYDEQIRNLTTQMQTYQQNENSSFTQKINDLTSLVNSKISNPIYNPPNASNSTQGSSNSSSGGSNNDSGGGSYGPTIIGTGTPNVVGVPSATPAQIASAPKDAGAIKNSTGTIVGGQGGGAVWGDDTWAAFNKMGGG